MARRKMSKRRGRWERKMTAIRSSLENFNSEVKVGNQTALKTRAAPFAVYIGLLSLYNDYRLVLGDVGTIYAIMLAMAGSVMISYTRARAEALGINCTVGLMQRAERVILIGFAALMFGEDGNGIVLKVVIYVLAVLTNLTVIQRIWWVWRNTRPDGVAVGDAIPRQED